MSTPYEPITFEELQVEMRRILEEELIPLASAKGHDYTAADKVDTLANVGQDLGWAGAFFRGRDKDARKVTALTQGNLMVSDDSMENNFRDRLNYAFYEYILWMRRTCDIKVTFVPLSTDDAEGGDSQ